MSALATFAPLDAIHSVGAPADRNADWLKAAMNLAAIWQLPPDEPLLASLANTLYCHVYSSVLRPLKASGGRKLSKEQLAAKQRLRSVKRGAKIIRTALEKDAVVPWETAMFGFLEPRDYNIICAALERCESLLAMRQALANRQRQGKQGSPPHPTFNEFVRHLRRIFEEFGGRDPVLCVKGILSLYGELPTSATSATPAGFNKRVKRALDKTPRN